VVPKVIRVTDQTRRNFLKSDYEVIQTIEDALYCDFCGYTGEDKDFEEVEEEKGKTTAETLMEQPFDKEQHYKNWLDWIKTIQEATEREYGELPGDSGKATEDGEGS
jgi:uncharacterized protein (DUF2225 family)